MLAFIAFIAVAAFTWDTFIRDPISEPVSNVECYFGGFTFGAGIGTATAGMFLCGEDITISSQPRGPIVNINEKEEGLN